MSKRLLSIIALALVLGVGLLYFWKHETVVAPVTPEPVVTLEPSPIPTPTDEPIDTSDWKTYRNEEYGFEFKYPKEYEVYDDYPEKKTIFISSVENSVHRVPGIFIKLAEDAISHQRLLNSISTTYKQSGYNHLISNEVVSIGLRKMIVAQKVVNSTEIGYDVTNYFFVVDGVPFQIEIKIPIPFVEEIISQFSSV